MLVKLSLCCECQKKFITSPCLTNYVTLVVVVSRLRLDCERDHLRASGGGNRGVAPLRKHIKLLLTYDYFATKKHGKKAE
jgi:hypothetical protein